jgi:hypothetical protein
MPLLEKYAEREIDDDEDDDGNDHDQENHLMPPG